MEKHGSNILSIDIGSVAITAVLLNDRDEVQEYVIQVSPWQG